MRRPVTQAVAVFLALAVPGSGKASADDADDYVEAVGDADPKRLRPGRAVAESGGDVVRRAGRGR